MQVVETLCFPLNKKHETMNEYILLQSGFNVAIITGITGVKTFFAQHLTIKNKQSNQILLLKTMYFFLFS